MRKVIPRFFRACRQKFSRPYKGRYSRGFALIKNIPNWISKWKDVGQKEPILLRNFFHRKVCSSNLLRGSRLTCPAIFSLCLPAGKKIFDIVFPTLCLPPTRDRIEHHPPGISPGLRAIDYKCGPMTCVLPKLTLSCGTRDMIHFMALGRVNDWLIPWDGLLFSSFYI